MKKMTWEANISTFSFPSHWFPLPARFLFLSSLYPLPLSLSLLEIPLYTFLAILFLLSVSHLIPKRIGFRRNTKVRLKEMLKERRKGRENRQQQHEVSRDKRSDEGGDDDGISSTWIPAGLPFLWFSWERKLHLKWRFVYFVYSLCANGKDMILMSSLHQNRWPFSFTFHFQTLTLETFMWIHEAHHSTSDLLSKSYPLYLYC